ncbi:MAG: hypothetical protein A2277_18840 [Desulfobacterales bacterium RIFOXYA12_FULL_46_15]|nr:MAG: hypothetical protein A2277_18840 [Desulfobacterales bacterium RIFOXYA12_FULL_46_15]
MVSGAFLILYLGKLPPYFQYWAKSCEPNHGQFHWFVYNDRIDQKKEYNRAVTLVPYSFKSLCSDLDSILHIHLPPQNTRVVCDCRIMLYAFRKDEDQLRQYDFVGYSDLDVVYGDISRFLPENPGQYSLITAADNRPCGPFTLFNRKYLETVLKDNRIKKRLEQNFKNNLNTVPGIQDEGSAFKPMSGNSTKDKIAEHLNFAHLDESEELVEIAKAYAPVFCKATPLQPAMGRWFNHRKAFAVWDNGRLYVRDVWGHQKEGAVFHFSRFKNRSRFRITSDALGTGQIGVYKYGFINAGSFLTRIKMFLTLLY